MDRTAHLRTDKSGNPSGGLSRRLRRLRRSLVGVLGFVIAALCAVAAYLAFPGLPGKSSTLTFDGFIKLPSTGLLSALDYLAIGDGQLFVSSISSGQVFVTRLDPVSSTIHSAARSSAGGGAAHGVALVDRTHTGLVTRSGINAVDIFDPVSLRTIARLKVAAGPDAILYDPHTNLVYVASGEAKMATLIDPVRNAVVATVKLPGHPEYAAQDERTGLVYQNIEDTGTVAVISLSGRAIVDRWSLASCQEPSGIAVDSLRQRLFVVCSGNHRLDVFELASHRKIASLPIGRLSDTAAYDPVLQRLYVAGGAGLLVVIEPGGVGAYRVVDRIQTHLGAHTLAVDPASHRLYVGYAGFFGAPRVAVFSPREITARIRDLEMK